MANKSRSFDPNLAFILELVLGIFGLLGIGYLYAGRTDEGVLRLVLWLLYNMVAWCSIAFLFALLVGFCLLPVQIAVQIGVPVWSAYTLKKKLQEQGVWPAS